MERGKWGEAILSTKENMISKHGVWNYGGNKGRKAERTLGVSMRKTTRERVEEMLGREFEGICKKGKENFRVVIVHYPLLDAWE